MGGFSGCSRILGIIAFLLLTDFETRGAPHQTFDVDSLVYLSSQIVEGTLGNEYRTNNDFRVCAFEVSKIHRGNFRVGQTIAVAILEPYYTSSSQDPRAVLQPLKSGNPLVLFLDLAKKVSSLDVPTNVEIYSPAPSGVMVVVGQKAVRFWQRSNPGPYEALLAGAETNSAVPTIEHLRHEISESIPKVEKWRSALDAKPTTNDIPVLLEILRSRKIPAHYRAEDFIAEKVCGKLVDLQDLPALASVVAS